jgi:protein gp37
MAENSKIEWCDHTFNAWTGCTKVSPACDNCYAESWAKRSGLVEWGNHPRRRTSEGYWKQPIKWNRAAERDGVRRKVFCCSLADVFDNQVDIGWRQDLYRLIYETPALDWLLLTKRPQNVLPMLGGCTLPDNVWLGTTVENQEEAERRIPHLLAVPAKIRFLSCEPLLGPISLWHMDEWEGAIRGPAVIVSGGVTTGSVHEPPEGYDDSYVGIDWVIAGGESGPKARPTHPAWFRSLRDQCISAGVPYFHKQNGEWIGYGTSKLVDADGSNGLPCEPADATDIEGFPLFRVGKKAAGAMLDGREWREFPA